MYLYTAKENIRKREQNMFLKYFQSSGKYYDVTLFLWKIFCPINSIVKITKTYLFTIVGYTCIKNGKTLIFECN